nr:CPBP family intramembrane glutamic endopeptidase [Salinirubrum litoreum]
MFVVAAVTSLLFVGPGEELLFRGVVQGRLREAFGPVAAITLGGVVFAVPHLVAAYTGPGSLVSIGVVFGVSLALGTLYEVSDTLVVPVVAHGLYNVAILAIVAVGAG